MQELLITLAKLMTQQECIERITTCIEEYNEAKMLGKELKTEITQILMSCHLLVLNHTKGNVKEVIDEMNMVNKSVNFFKTDKNKN
jgi:hypothetical protein